MVHLNISKWRQVLKKKVSVQVAFLLTPIDCFHSRGQHRCKFIGTKENVCIRRVQLPQNWFGTSTWPPFHCFGTPIWPPWRHVETLCGVFSHDVTAAILGRFIVLGHQYGHRDVMWKVFTWRHGGHIGVPKLWNGGHVGVPKKSSGSLTLFSCKWFLLFH